VQGREEKAAQNMLEDALALEVAGADLLLLECVPAALGRSIAEAVKVPVIGIGAGAAVDGQILVLYDVLDLTIGRKPRFARNFMLGNDSPQAALAAYVQAVKSGEYPAPEHCF
jgi:3-methyl-2-oxobutanoate hydroxymethyltransferase